MSDITDLIAKLEVERCATREAHNAIAEIIGERMPDDPTGWPPFYTASLDAAMTLVPDHVHVRLQAYDNGSFGAHAWLYAPSTPVHSNTKIWGEAHIRPYSDAHRLFALALCVAVLRARMIETGA